MSTQLQKSPQEKVKDVRAMINSPAIKNQIIAALPKHLTPERMMRVINTAITNTPKLAECTQQSLIVAIIQATELGLEPNTPLGQAYLIPYGNQVQFQIGYRGFLALARRSGEISFAVSELVYANDLFKIKLGTSRELIHEPLLTGNRGDKIGVYSLVQYKDGTNDFEYMTAEDVEKIRKRSKSGDNGPWKTDTNEMWRKTPMRRHAKRWPMSADVAGVIARDEYTDYGIQTEQVPPRPVITETQRGELVKLAKKHNVPNAQLTAIHQARGFDLLAHITVDTFDDIQAEVVNANAVDGTIEPEPVSEVTTEPIDESVCAKLREQITEAINEKGGFFELGSKVRKEIEQTPLAQCFDPARLEELLSMVTK